MYNLGPEARKRQQMMLQKNKSPNQRQTRQLDSTKTRSTFNSRHEKLLNEEVTMKKKNQNCNTIQASPTMLILVLIKILIVIIWKLFQATQFPS